MSYTVRLPLPASFGGKFEEFTGGAAASDFSVLIITGNGFVAHILPANLLSAHFVWESHAPCGAERVLDFDEANAGSYAGDDLMNDAPRRTLRELIDRHGPGLCSDARRCQGLLRDLCGEHRREINILSGALQERVPLDLLAAQNSVPVALLLTRLARRLEDQLALTQEASHWAVDSWALALGVISDAELEVIQRRRDAEAAPPIESLPVPPPATTRPKPSEPERLREPVSPPHVPRPTAAPPRAQQSPLPPATRTPAAPKQTAPPPPHATPAPRTRARTNASPPTANTHGRQEPAGDAEPRGMRRRWRGCLIGCFLLLLLAAVLTVGVPFVINLLREEQQQRNLEPPRIQTP